jgi:hypothetical protein
MMTDHRGSHTVTMEVRPTGRPWLTTTMMMTIGAVAQSHRPCHV